MWYNTTHMENLTKSTHAEQATPRTIVEPEQTPSTDIIDPDNTTIAVTIDSLFDPETPEKSMRVGLIESIQVLPQNNKSAISKEPMIGVKLYTGDTGSHTPLRQRAGIETSVFDMPEATGCTKASISVTAEPGDTEYPGISQLIAGVEIPRVVGEKPAEPAELAKRERNAENLMRRVGKAASCILQRDLSDLQKEEEGRVIIIESGEPEPEPDGDFYETITVGSPDTAGKS